jgi:hypothetical protein
MTDIFPMEIYLEYCGPIDFLKKKDLVSHLTEKLDELDLHLTIRRRCVYVAEELMTNAHDYYKKRELGEETIKLLIKQPQNSHLELCISNTLLKTDTVKMLDKINIINREEGAQLRDLFNRSLSEENTDSTGGGIGLITIKLKTGLKFTAEVIEKNEAQNTLNLTTTINLNL